MTKLISYSLAHHSHVTAQWVLLLSSKRVLINFHHFLVFKLLWFVVTSAISFRMGSAQTRLCVKTIKTDSVSCCCRIENLGRIWMIMSLYRAVSNNLQGWMSWLLLLWSHSFIPKFCAAFTVYRGAFRYLKRLIQFYTECNQAPINLEVLPVEGLGGGGRGRIYFLICEGFYF